MTTVQQLIDVGDGLFIGRTLKAGPKEPTAERELKHEAHPAEWWNGFVCSLY